MVEDHGALAAEMALPGIDAALVPGEGAAGSGAPRPGTACFDRVKFSGMIFAHPVPAFRRVRNRDSIAPCRRAMRWMIRATRASLPSGLRGNVSFNISTISRGVSNSSPGCRATRCWAMNSIASITIATWWCHARQPSA